MIETLRHVMHLWPELLGGFVAYFVHAVHHRLFHVLHHKLLSAILRHLLPHRMRGGA